MSNFLRTQISAEFLTLCLILTIPTTSLAQRHLAAAEIKPSGTQIRTAGLLVTNAGGIVRVSDSSSSIYGASVSIPAGALSKSLVISLKDGSYWGGTELPSNLMALGKSVSLNPFLQSFTKSVIIQIPYDSSLLPQKADIKNSSIYGFDGSSWNRLTPDSIGASSLPISTSKFDYYALIAAIEIPILDGQIRIDTNANGGTVYIDGLFYGDTAPGLITGLSPGSHVLKIYREGYNEILRTVSSPSQKMLDLQMSIPSATAPVVKLDPSLIDGAASSDNLILITGKISSAKISSTDFIVLSQNNRDTIQPISGDGSFKIITPLFKGKNRFQIRATVSGQTGVSATFTISHTTRAIVNTPTQPSSSQQDGLASQLEQDSRSKVLREQKLKNAR